MITFVAKKTGASNSSRRKAGGTAWGVLILAAFFLQQPGVDGADPPTLGGRVVDDETGAPIVDFVVQRSTFLHDKPEEVIWMPASPNSARGEHALGLFSGVQQFDAHSDLRFFAPGYVPQTFSAQLLTNLAGSAFEVRLQKGEKIAGIVRDADGQPMAGGQIFLATYQGLSLQDGRQPPIIDYNRSSTTTDNAGHFELRGMEGNPERIVVVSPDGHLVWPEFQKVRGTEWNITLPKPGTVIINYDSPGDVPEPVLGMSFTTPDDQMPLWKGIRFTYNRSLTLSNGGQIVLTNMTPGVYHFGRFKPTDGGPSKGGQAVECELPDVVVEAGQTQRAEVVPANGQRIRGRVTGLEQLGAKEGVIAVRSSDVTGQSWPVNSRNAEKDSQAPFYDVVKFGADGNFQTGPLSPGTYTVVASVYPPQTPGLMGSFRNNTPDHQAATKITVTAEATPEVTIQLVPENIVDISGTVVDDETGLPVNGFIIQFGTVDPKNPGEITWQPGYQGGISIGGGFGVAQQRDTPQFVARNQKAGSAMRFWASGYVPATNTQEEVVAARQTANLQVRLKRGGELHGTVLNNDGTPVLFGKVRLAPLNLGELPGAGLSNTRTDGAGHFSLRGVGNGMQRLIVGTPDDEMVFPVQVSMPAEDLKITLPKPATLVCRYGIPGDTTEAHFDLRLITNDLEMPLWQGVRLELWDTATNGGELVWKNLTPGTYEISRNRQVPTPNTMYGFMYGDPPATVRTEFQRFVVKSGETQEFNLTRSTGQPVRGEVTGLESIHHDGGPFPFVFVVPANAIMGPLDFKTNRFERCFDEVVPEKDGHFRTALLEPGTYTLVVEVYVECDPEVIPPGYEGDNPDWVRRPCPGQLTCVGSAKVTVTANAAPTPVKIELRPWVDPPNAP